MQINEEQEEIITDIAERYVNAMIWNINAISVRCFTISWCFSIFDLEKVPTGCSSNEFTVYCNSEVEILCGYYFGNDDEKRNEFMNEWDSFRFEVISMRKKWLQLKENLSQNKLKPDINATECLLKQIWSANSIDEYPIVISIGKIAFITTDSNAWPERGRSAIKRIKTN